VHGIEPHFAHPSYPQDKGKVERCIQNLNRGNVVNVKPSRIVRRLIDAIGARWGILSEKAFREGLRGIVERELGLRIEKWIRWDGEGYVFGHPSAIDVDVSISDEK